MSSFLIVDDSPRKMQFLRSIVDRSGWKGDILEAMTTEDAMDVIDKTPDISAAFVDYYVPKQYGPAVIAYLYDKRPHARIALVSSADSVENAEEARAAGAETVLCTSYQSDVVEKNLLELLAAWQENH